jgi:hypothetical protein
MPAKSQQQRKLIFAKRGQYGSESDTPKQWKWVWHEGWENKGKLPKKVRKKKKKKYESIVTFSDYLLNEGLITVTGRVDVPEENIIEKIETVEKWFKYHQDDDHCYIQLFGHPDWRINRDRIEEDIRAAARMATSL